MPQVIQFKEYLVSLREEERLGIVKEFLTTLDWISLKSVGVKEEKLRKKLRKREGYSGHEPNLQPTNEQAHASIEAHAMSLRKFGLDCEFVRGTWNSFTRSWKMMAGQVVVVESIENSKKVVYKTYIKYEDGLVTDYMTRWSSLDQRKLNSSESKPLTVVQKELHDLLSQGFVVTLGGSGDFRALGMDITEYKGIDLHDHFYFAHDDDELGYFGIKGNPCGLGPLVYFFNYRDQNGKRVIIKHNCEDDAWYALRIYLDHYEKDETRLEPPFKKWTEDSQTGVMNGKKYRALLAQHSLGLKLP